MSNAQRLTGLFCVVLLGTPAALAQSPAKDRVENTGAFLVKLKPQVTTRGAPVQDEWELTPLVSEAQTRGESTAMGNWWYLEPRSKPPSRGEPSIASSKGWDAAYELYAGKPSGGGTRSGAKTRGPLVTRGIKTDEIDFIEPDLRYFLPSSSTSKSGATAAAVVPGKAVAGSAPTRHWPQFPNVGAYQEANYSQLKPAREAVEAKLASVPNPDKVRVRVAFFDNGYDPKHATCPPHINMDLARNFVEGKNAVDGVPLKNYPGFPGSQSHGTGTIGIFGGRPIDLVDASGNVIFSGPLGGAPMAEIIPVRVATSVVHLENPLDETPLIKVRSSGTTRAIYYAIANNCDVISMSHGGLPSEALADAINAAYEHGIAMFFASGDYLQPPNWPVHSPSYVVYPAAFRRTICVCGVTADLKTYGKPPKNEYDPNDGPVESWRLRGNWGPSACMKYAIAGFSPNIPWAHLPNPKLHEINETVVDLDGQGTSASTPQVASAATLWLQYYRDDPDLQNVWRTWRKAELVYQALLTSAKKVFDTADANYSDKYFGNGVLQAKDALGKKPKDISPTVQKKASVGLGWLRLISSVAAKTRAPGVSDEVLKEMLGLEIAQVVQQSAKLQEIMEKYDQAEPDEDANVSEENLAKFQKEFLTAIKEEPAASKHLKEAATRTLSGA